MNHEAGPLQEHRQLGKGLHSPRSPWWLWNNHLWSFGSKFPQKKAKLAADEDDEDNDDDDEDDDVDFEDEEAEEKAPGKESLRDTPGKNAQKSNQNGRDSKPSTPRSKGQEYFKKQEKIPKTPKGPSSIEVIKAKIQASIEEGGSLPKVEAKFINYVKNCFRMTDPEVIQHFGHWRKCLIENSLNNKETFKDLLMGRELVCGRISTILGRLAEATDLPRAELAGQRPDRHSKPSLLV
ncbi:nucleophosmin-like [Molossus nigricans]